MGTFGALRDSLGGILYSCSSRPKEPVLIEALARELLAAGALKRVAGEWVAKALVKQSSPHPESEALNVRSVGDCPTCQRDFLVYPKRG